MKMERENKYFYELLYYNHEFLIYLLNFIILMILLNIIVIINHKKYLSLYFILKTMI